MGYKNKQIKVPTNGRGETLVKVGKHRAVDERIVFSFSFFNGHSIKISNFNNFYGNKADAVNAVGDFFETLKSISTMAINQFFPSSFKTQFHYNEFNDDNIIDRIEGVLINGYGMPREKVDEFERMYFEFAFSNGKRAIGTKIYDNIFEILFLDNNHLICRESSRDVKIKYGFGSPSVFSKVDFAGDFKEYDRKELLNMLIDSAKRGECTSLDEFIKDYDDLFVES